jgi:hypothetical protein
LIECHFEWPDMGVLRSGKHGKKNGKYYHSVR